MHSRLSHTKKPPTKFLPFLIPALIAGAATVGATALSNRAARANSQTANKAQVEVAKEQTEAAKEQADKQFENDMAAMELQRKWDLEDREDAKANPTIIKGEIDFKKMAADAEAAGFNPLTAIRNGGSAGFASSSQPSAPLSRQAPTRQAPLRQVAGRSTPSYQSAGAAGLGVAADFMSNFDPFMDQKREMEAQLVEAQIANLNSSTNLNNARKFGGVPSYTAGNRAIQMGSGVRVGATVNTNTHMGATPVANPPGVVPVVPPKFEPPKVSNPYGLSWFRPDPNRPDAGAWEDRLGDDVGGWLGAGVNLTSDIRYNLIRHAVTGLNVANGVLSRVATRPHASPNQSLRSAMGH